MTYLSLPVSQALVSGFLLSCLREVIRKNKGVSPHVALQQEIERIDAALAESRRSLAALATFQLMKEFFKRTQDKVSPEEKDIQFLYTAGPQTYTEIYKEMIDVCDVYAVAHAA